MAAAALCCAPASPLPSPRARSLLKPLGKRKQRCNRAVIVYPLWFVLSRVLPAGSLQPSPLGGAGQRGSREVAGPPAPMAQCLLHQPSVPCTATLRGTGTAEPLLQQPRAGQAPQQWEQEPFPAALQS